MNLSEFGIKTVSESIENLKSKCIEVYESPSQIISPTTGEIIHDGFYTISNKNGNIHGKVSNKGSVLTMDRMLDIAYDVNLNNNFDLNFDKAKLNYFKNESVCTLRIPLGVSSFVNNNGIKDDTEVFLFIKTGFGGKSSLEVGVYTNRFVCSNGLEIRHGLDFFKSKHTENMNLLAQTFLSKNLPKMVNSTNDYTQLAKRLDKSKITKEDIEAFKKELFDYDLYATTSTRKSNQIKSFEEALDQEFSRSGKSAWGFLQGATNYTNNYHSKKGNEFVSVGTGASFNSKAEKMALSLV